MKRKLSRIAGFLILFAASLITYLYSCKKLDPERQLMVKTESVNQISFRSCEATALLIDVGTGVVQHGFCWGEQAEPGIEGPMKTEMGTKGSSGGFAGFIPDLEPGTRYYIRAYATDSKKTMYGVQKSFTTLSITAPEVEIIRLDSIRENSFFVECEVFSDGGEEVTERGVCWNIGGSPDIDDNKIPLGNGMGIYSCTIEALDPATTYFIKAYAINGQGIAYGVEHEVTTASPAIISDYWVADAEVLPLEIVAGTNFIVNCRHFSNGQDDTDRPVKVGYFLSADDVFDLGDIYLGFDESNIGSTEFSDESSELTLPGGTEVGNRFILFYSDFESVYPENNEDNNISAVEFTVEPLVPLVTTFLVGDVTDNSANTGGEVLEDHGLAVVERGVCWSTTPGPEITDMKTINGGGLGIFYSAITTLNPDTKYYLRAYAITSSGTGYGEELVFTTKTGEIVYDYDGNMYQVIRIGSQEWLTSNMKATTFTTGEPIPLVEGNWTTVGLADKAYRWYGNDIGNKDLYGALYSWAAAMNGSPGNNNNPSGIQGVCPDGWHIPSISEWDQLRDYLIDNGYNWDGSLTENKIGKAMALTSSWNAAAWAGLVGNDPRTNNASGFSAVPGGGIRSSDNQYYSLGANTYMWSATNGDYASAFARKISSQGETLSDATLTRAHGISVRCLKGQGAVPPVANFEADRTTIAAGETVYFTDLSEWVPESWEWNFGYMDASSNLQNPSFTYIEEGVYTVTLVVFNAAGEDIETKINYITVTSSD